MSQQATETLASPPGPAPAGGELEAWKKLATLCLEAVAKHPVQFSGADGAAFSERIQESLAALGKDTEPAQILVTAGSIAEAVNRHNTETQHRMEELIGQFRALLKVLGERNLGWSAALKAELEKMLAATDWPDLEARLPACVQSAKGAREGSSTPGGGLGHGPGSSAGAADPCTGLPMKADAEAAIHRALEGDSQCFVAMFYLHRMHLINARFGDAIGNQVILFCSQHIATHLTGATDALFRWRGPGFVALLERSDSPLAVASEVQRFTSMPLSRFFETPSRTVYLPIKLTGEVLALHGKTFEDVLTSVQHSLHTRAETGD
jgi:GGDEF domain-containing protein